MSVEFVSPIMRLVQGSLSLEIKKDPATDKPKLDDQGQPIRECFIACAIRKDDPALPAFYGLFQAAARAEFPHLFDAAGNCTHPRFAFKWQDGDGVDNTGQSVAGKAGFAGHWIVKMATRYLPKCYHEGKFDPAQQIQNPNDVIKRGYFIRVAGRISGNGVTAQDRQAVPGLFVSPNLVSLVAFGEEIVSGPDASKVFGAAPVPAALPAGASAVPMSATPGLTPPPAPALPAVPGPALPAPALPAVPLPPAPPAPAAPLYQMTAAAQGATREALIANGWTDELLIQHGYMVKS